MSVDTLVVGLPVEDLDTPALLVDLPAMDRNIARIADTLAAAGVSWRPHTKGQKVPAIAHKEIAAGAIGITCAKLGEAEVMAAAGISSILIANQVVGAQKATRLANLCRHAEVIAAVDSLENIMELDEAGRRKGLRVPVVVELDVGMGRCGVVPGEPAVVLSKRAHERHGLQYLGLMAWEGHARRIKELDKRKIVVESALMLLTETAAMCREAGLPVSIVSCGGTGTERFSSQVPGITEIQAGGIIFNDMYYTSLGLDHEYALKVISTITSRSTSKRIVTDAGRKTMSSDTAAPRPIGIHEIKSVSLSAEHGVIELTQPDLNLRVGDRIQWIVGYGDTTVCLHDVMFGVRDGIVETVWPISARGKLL